MLNAIILIIAAKPHYVVEIVVNGSQNSCFVFCKNVTARQEVCHRNRESKIDSEKRVCSSHTRNRAEIAWRAPKPDRKSFLSRVKIKDFVFFPKCNSARERLSSIQSNLEQF